MGDSQSLRMGDGSNAVQVSATNATIVIPPYETVVKIVHELFGQNFPRLQEEAQRVATERMGEFAKTVAESLRANVDRIDGARLVEPIVQAALATAGQQAALHGSADGTRLLADLVCALLVKDRPDLLQLVAYEAIGVVPKLTQRHLEYLALHVLVSEASISYSSLDHAEQDGASRLARFTQAMNCTRTDFQYLAAVGAVTVGLAMVTKELPPIYRELDGVEKLKMQIARIDGDHEKSSVSRIIEFREKMCVGAGVTLTAVGSMIGWAGVLPDGKFVQTDWSKVYG